MAPVNIDGTDITAATIDGTTVSQITVDGDVVFSTGTTRGFQMVVGDRTVGDVFMFSLSTAYDLSTATQDTSFNPGGDIRAVHINPDGTTLHVANKNGSFKQFSLSTAFDLNTATLSQDLSFNSRLSGIEFGDGGTRMYISNEGTGTIEQFTLSSPFDGSTRSSISKETGFNLGGGTCASVLADSGTRFYVTKNNGSNVAQFDLSTAFDISTRSLVQTAELPNTADNRGLGFQQDGTTLICDDDDNDVLHEFELSSAYDISTASEVDTISSPSGDNMGLDLS